MFCRRGDYSDGFARCEIGLSRGLRDRLQVQELINAVEALIKQLPTTVQDREVKRVIASVQESIAAITRTHGRTYDHEPEEK